MPEEILQFWFGELSADGGWDREHARRWFRGEPQFDALVRERFGGTIEAVRAGQHDDWRTTLPGTLALILIADQLTRNAARGRAEAFSLDPLARELSLALIDDGRDRQLHAIERLFVYLPLEHSENLQLQDVCVGLLVDLATEAPPELHGYFRQFVRYAMRHREVIAKFGRYPHRNRALGRASTEAELEHLRNGGDTFGFSIGSSIGPNDNRPRDD
jgi:uncharacterized protein (DUF924 family)